MQRMRAAARMQTLADGSPALWDQDADRTEAPHPGTRNPPGTDGKPSPPAPTPAAAGKTSPPTTPPAARQRHPRRTLLAAAVGGVALLSVPFLLMAPGSHGKSTDRQGALADIPQDAVPGSRAPSSSGSHSPSASKSAASAAPSTSAGHHAPKPKPRPGNGHPAGPGGAPTVDSPAKNALSGGSLAPAGSRLFGGASQALLHNRATGLCADLPDLGNGAANGPVNEFHCQAGDADNQMWNLQMVQGKGPGGANLFVVRNTKDNLCMDLPDFGGQPAGTKVSEFPCNGSAQDNQTWYVWPGQDNHYQLRNSRSGGLCLGVDGGPGAGPDARLQLRPCGPADTDWSWSGS